MSEVRMTEVDLELRERAREHQSDLDARIRGPQRLPAFEYYTAEESAQFLGISVGQLLRFVPPTFYATARTPRWDRAELVSLERAEGECHVYAIRRPDTREIKIGVNTNPVRRLRDIQSVHARTVELLIAFPGTAVEEVALHQRFAASRLRGEWFDESPEITAWITERSC